MNNKFLQCCYLLTIIVLSSCSGSYKAITKDKEKYGEYDAVIPKYEKLLSKTKNDEMKAQINYQIAESYRMSNRMEESLPYYQAAIQGGKTSDKLWLSYGLALKSTGNYKEAEEAFSKASKGTTPSAKRANQELKNLAEVQKLSVPNKNVEIVPCTGLNSTESDYAPVIQSGKIYFSSNRRKEAVYIGNGKGFDDLYEYNAQPNDPCQGNPKMLSPVINTDQIHDATCSFSADGKKMIFARSSRNKEKQPFEIKLYESVFNDTGWTKPREIQEINSGYWDGCPALSPDGNILIFSSNRPGKTETGGAYGGLDLYRSTMGRDGKWTTPMNLGSKINTAGNEMFPFIVSKEVFYFASDGQPGLGGLDIIRASRDGSSYQLNNLGAPINSPYDDFAICFRDSTSGYFSSNRKGGMGSDDIYAFKINTPKDRVIIYYLAGTVFEKNTNKPITNASVFLYSTDNKLLDSTSTNEEGGYRFKIQIPLDTDFAIKSSKTPDYLPYEGSFSSRDKRVIPDEFASDTIEVVFDKDIEMTGNKFVKLLEEKKPQDDEFDVEIEILYDLDQDTIRRSEMHKLDDLAEFLLKNPDVKIELGSHTDARASFAYNMDLSERRARSAVRYLVSKGVDPQRITAKGYGKTRLKVNKAVMTEEDHQMNRRTTIKRLRD